MYCNKSLQKHLETLSFKTWQAHHLKSWWNLSHCRLIVNKMQWPSSHNLLKLWCNVTQKRSKKKNQMTNSLTSFFLTWYHHNKSLTRDRQLNDCPKHGNHQDMRMPFRCIGYRYRTICHVIINKHMWLLASTDPIRPTVFACVMSVPRAFNLFRHAMLQCSFKYLFFP